MWPDSGPCSTSSTRRCWGPSSKRRCTPPSWRPPSAPSVWSREAHGKGVALQLNYLLDAGAFKMIAKNGTFSVDPSKVKAAVAALTTELLKIEANGDKAKAAELLGKMATVRPEVQKVLDKLNRVPVDVAPTFPTALKLLAEDVASAPQGLGRAVRAERHRRDQRQL